MNPKCDLTWSKSGIIQTNGGAKVTVFARVSESTRRRHSSSSHQNESHTCRTELREKQRWRERGLISTFEDLSSVRLFFYHLFAAALPLWNPHDSWLGKSHTTILVHSYWQSPDGGGRLLWVGTSTLSFTAVQQAAPSFFWPAPLSLDSSPSPSSPSLTSPLLSARQSHLSLSLYLSLSLSLLSSIAVVTKAVKRTTRKLSACVASRIIHNDVYRLLDKNRVKHRRTIFSTNKALESSKGKSMNGCHIAVHDPGSLA